MKIEPDPRTAIGLLAAMLQRHPELIERTDPAALERVELHTQMLVDRALRYTFNGARLPRADDAPHSH